MKRILSLLSVSAVLVCCSDLRTDENLSGGVDDTVPSTPVEPGTNEDELLPLVLNFGTSAMTKALVEDTVLPTGSSVGITIRDDYGRYTGDDYTNIRYSSALSAGVQVWETTSPVLLARETGTLFSYWPHSEDEVDGKTITVAATSDVQTDYMWGLPVAVSKSNRTASITMQHALSAVRIYCKRGSYTGAGEITGVAFGGDCAATAGILDLTCGALDDLSGQGTMIAPAITAKTITDSYQKVSDIIVVPASGTNGKVVVTLDGTDYPIEFSTLDLNPGEMSEFYLTANDGELSATDITVGDWTYGDPEGDEIVVSNKVKITGDISNIAFNNTVSEDGTVTIKAIPTSGEKSFTEVEPVTYTGTATLTQSSDIDTGIRTITITDIASDVIVNFAGIIEWNVVAEYDVVAGNETQQLLFVDANLIEGDRYEMPFIRTIRYGDQDISSDLSLTYKTYSSSSALLEIYRHYKFPQYGKQIIKYSFVDSYIGYSCFKKTAMSSVRISENVTIDVNSLFRNCTSLVSAKLPVSGWKNTNMFFTFEECTSLKKVNIPDFVTNISYLFNGCTSLETITLPSELTQINRDCFAGTALMTIIIPSKVNTVAQNAFANSPIQTIISYAVTAPTLGTQAGLQKNGILIVPQGATGYDSWMEDYPYSTSYGYLGDFDWTLVYMNE